MADIIDEEIELHLIDTSQLVAEAKKLKELKRIADQTKKVKKQLTFSVAPTSFTGIPRDVLPSQRTGGRKEAITGAKTSNEFKQIKKKQEDAERKIKNFEKTQKVFTKDIQQLQKDITDNLGLATDLLQSTAGIGAVAGILSVLFSNPM